jgi:hypothetical protein
LHGGVLWDDAAHITPPALRSLHGLWRIWTDLMISCWSVESVKSVKSV